MEATGGSKGTAIEEIKVFPALGSFSPDEHGAEDDEYSCEDADADPGDGCCRGARACGLLHVGGCEVVWRCWCWRGGRGVIVVVAVAAAAFATAAA